MTTERSEGPPGSGDPWVIVLGMHRSGTSALTGALVRLGFRTHRPEDRMDWPESNAEHWESLSLTLFDDLLLDRLGGSWEAPPDLPSGWERSTGLPSASTATAVLRAAFPGRGPVVWKDPRLCLLLPWWQQVLPGPLAVVLLWRPPHEVADSLQRRDSMPVPQGLALWERYNRSALRVASALPTFVAEHGDLARHPAELLGGLATWMGTLDRFSGTGIPRDTDGAVELLGDAPPARSAEPPPGLVLASQLELVDTLHSLAGAHPRLDPPAGGAEGEWTSTLLRTARDYRSRELSQARAKIESMERSTSWRVTMPLRELRRLAEARAARRPEGPTG